MQNYVDLLRQRDIIYFQKYGKIANSKDFKELLNLFEFSGSNYCGKGLAYSSDGVTFYVSGHDYDFLRSNYERYWSFSYCVKPYFEWNETQGIIKFIERM